MLTDIEIAQQTKLRPIAEIAEELHVCPEELEPYGRFKAKLNDDLFKRLENEPDGKLILVTAINPTPAGGQDHHNGWPRSGYGEDRQKGRHRAA